MWSLYENETEEEKKTDNRIIADALIRILRNQVEMKKHFGLIKDDSYYGDCHYDESIIEELEEIE